MAGSGNAAEEEARCAPPPGRPLTMEMRESPAWVTPFEAPSTAKGVAGAEDAYVPVDLAVNYRCEEGSYSQWGCVPPSGGSLGTHALSRPARLQ